MVWAPIAMVAIAAVSTGAQVYEQERQRAAENKANQQSQSMEQLQAQRNAVMAIRRSRIAQANVQAASAGESGNAGGLQPSSGVQGTVGGIQTQTNVNLGFAQQMDQLTARRYSYMAQANTAGGFAQAAGEVGQASMQSAREMSYYG